VKCVPPVLEFTTIDGVPKPVPELSHEDFKCIDEIVDRDPSKRNRFVNFDAIWGTSQFDHDA
jgi:hypothetical protein